jgi:hypothetical protein
MKYTEERWASEGSTDTIMENRQDVKSLFWGGQVLNYQFYMEVASLYGLSL